MRRLGAREANRQTEWGCCEGYVFILNTGLPHRDNQRLPGKCPLKKKQTENEKFRTQHQYFFFSPSWLAEEQTAPFVHSWQITHAKVTFFHFKKK